MFSGPILENKGMCAIFQKKGKKGPKMLKMGKILKKKFGKNVQYLKIFEKGQKIACDNCTQ